MIHPLIVGNIRHDPSKLIGPVLLISIETSVLLTQIGVARATQDPHALMISHWLSGLMAFVFWVAVLISAIYNYVDVLERNADFGLLRILGASYMYLSVLLFQETALVTVLAALPGLFLAYIGGEMFELASGGLVKVSIPYLWIPVIAAIVEVPAFLGALCAMPRAIDGGMKAAL